MSSIFQKSAILLDVFHSKDILRRLYLEKKFFTSNQTYQYFLKLYRVDSNGSYYCDGYIYFYLNELRKESSFIGLYIKTECRNSGLASLLVANWLKLCMDNGFYNFTTNKKQRKPFLIYLLKKMGFEIEDENKYNTSNFTIKLYQSPLNNNKYLKFMSDSAAAKFMNSSIAREDSYNLLPENTEGFNYIDQALQSNIYTLQDNNEAYARSRNKLESHGII